jgi:DUF1365 family protein
MGSQIYVGQVAHARQQPVEYRFAYRSFSIKIDIDCIEQEAHSLRWLSVNRFNLVSLKYQDHGPRDGTPWRQWIDGFLAQYGVARPARVELICYPRILGYSFNPLSMWYAYAADNRLVAIIAEVSNTFAQWHHYVLKVAGCTEKSIQAQAQKVFHVSPFIDMDAHYHFRFGAPADKVFTSIRETRAGVEFFSASEAGHALALTDQNLLKQVGFAPLSMLKVIALIHWWALKILIKGGTFHRTPKHLEAVQYSHSEMTLC